MVQPNRRICQVPSGTSQRKMPSFESFARQVHHLCACVSSSPAWAGSSSNSGVVSGAEKCSALYTAFCSQFWIGMRPRPCSVEASGSDERLAPDPIRHHGDVTVEPVAGLGHRQAPDRTSPGPGQCFRPGQLLGRVLGLDHRPAEVPAALDIQAHLQPQAIGLAQGVLVELAPFGREESGAVRHAVVAILLRPAGIADQRPAKAFGLHLLQVAGDGGLGHIAVKPPPIGPQPGAVGRIGKALRQLVGLRRAGTAAWNPELGQDAKQNRAGHHQSSCATIPLSIRFHWISSSNRSGFTGRACA